MRERGPGRYDALWLNAQGKPLTTDGIRQIVGRLAAEASVTGRHNLHAFCHRVAQTWLDNGINAEIVSKALGHADRHDDAHDLWQPGRPESQPGRS
jgi:site-specific recombinase XerD